MFVNYRLTPYYKRSLHLLLNVSTWYTNCSRYITSFTLPSLTNVTISGCKSNATASSPAENLLSFLHHLAYSKLSILAGSQNNPNWYNFVGNSDQLRPPDQN